MKCIFLICLVTVCIAFPLQAFSVKNNLQIAVTVSNLFYPNAIGIRTPEDAQVSPGQTWTFSQRGGGTSSCSIIAAQETFNFKDLRDKSIITIIHVEDLNDIYSGKIHFNLEL